MRVSLASPEDRASSAAAAVGGTGYRDAESLFRTKPISEIRNVEATTNDQIHAKKEELRLLVGNRYRDLIDSADSIVSMKSSCESITANLSTIHHNIFSLSASPVSDTPKFSSPNPARVKIYGIACRVKYLVDTPENIWGCLDESMFLEAAARYIRAKHVQQSLMNAGDAGALDSKILSYFPLLQHQWQIVESFKAQISQRSRERLLDRGLGVCAYADALAAVSVIDDLEPKQVLILFLDTRKSWVMQKLGTFIHDAGGSVVVSVFCEVLRIIQVSVGQVGELFLQVLNDMPLFYKVILGSPPASQLFGGIPNPDEEVRLWKLFRDKLESVMVMLDKECIAKTCLTWLRDCRVELVNEINGRYFIDAIASGQELAYAEKLIRDTMDSKDVLEGSLDWLKSVFGSEIELPWSRIRELILEDDSDLWDEIFEDAFTQRMKKIIDLGFDDLTGVVNMTESVRSIVDTPGEQIDFQAYLNRPSTGGGVWFIDPNAKNSYWVSTLKSQFEENDFRSCLNAYFGPEVSRIRDAVDSCCQNVLGDLLSFLDSPKAAPRLKDLAPYLQDKCYQSLSAMLTEIKKLLDSYDAAMERHNKEGQNLSPVIVIERSLFIGRLLFSFQNHSKHILVLLGSPRSWANEIKPAAFDKLPSMSGSTRGTDSPAVDSPGRHTSTFSRRQASSAAAALLGANESASPTLEELSGIMRDLCIRAHNLWISWLSDELSVILSRALGQDNGLSATSPTPLSGWEETVVKQEDSDVNQSEMKISLPYVPSLYIISFLFRACEEIHRIGGHVLDKSILQKFASRLLEKVTVIYEDFLSKSKLHGSQVSEKGVLQVLLDLRFTADILSGGDGNIYDDLSKTPKSKFPFRRKQDQNRVKSVMRERIDGLFSQLSQKLDPIDWLTYEPYLWENERQSYVRHAVLFGFFVQLNRMYMDTIQKLPTNSESNIMRCSTVPRFKYLPISAPALSSRTTKTSIPASDNISSRGSWKAYSNGDLSPKIDLDDNSNFGVAAPFLKSFMQVGSRFGESTLKLGSILTDGQVGIFKDRSASAMSTFGDILPAQAAGLLSSFTANRSDS